MNSNLKTLIFWVVLICVAVLLIAVVRTGQGTKEEQITFTEFLDKVQQGQVAEVTITGNEVHGDYANHSLGFHTFIPRELPERLQAPARQERQRQHQGHQFGRLGFDPGERVAVHRAAGVLDLHDAADAERRQQGAELRQEPRAAAFHAAEEGDVQGCGRRGRGQGRAAGDHRIPARAAEIPEAGRPHSQGRAADRASGNRQDAAGARHRGRSQRAVLLHLRFGFRGDVRGRGREPRARSVRAGQEERAVHHLHR